MGYSLQHGNRKLRAFAKANGLLTDDGENIDDPEAGGSRETRGTRGRRTDDPTARKRYVFIAAAAIDIASRNPEGEVEKQILAAAEHLPAPLMPVLPDLFAELLLFLSDISARATDSAVRTDARLLAAKMRLHRPAPKAEDVPAVAAAGGKNSQRQSEEYRLRKARQHREYKERKKAKLAARAVSPTPPSGAAPASHQTTQPAVKAQTPKQETAERPQLCMKTPKVTMCPPARSPDAEELIRWGETAAPAQPGTRHGEYVLSEARRWEFTPEGDAKGLPQAVTAPEVAVTPDATTRSAAQCAA